VSTVLRIEEPQSVNTIKNDITDAGESQIPKRESSMLTGLETKVLVMILVTEEDMGRLDQVHRAGTDDNWMSNR